MIAEAEDAIEAAIKSALGETVQTVETLPGPWDQDALALAFRKMPGVWIYFDGGGPGRGGNRLAARFLVYAVTGHASGGRERRRGNTRQIGAYEIVERVVPVLDQKPLEKMGSLRFDGLRVLTPASAQRKGIAAYEMAFQIDLAFPASRDAGDLADFKIYSATHQVGDGPPTETYVELPTDEETSP